MNIFEGSRRLIKVIAIIWVAGIFLFLSFLQNTYTHVYYVISDFGASPRVEENCPTNSATEYLDSWAHKTAKGNPISITLCFLSGDNSPDGSIPYFQSEIKKESFVWVDSKYSKDVREYTKKYSKEFKIPENHFQQLDSIYRTEWWKTTGETLLINTVGLLVFWLMTWGIGYIVRGFMGIESSADKKN